MNLNDISPPPDHERPESQPHGTTEDQIHEMESEGPGNPTQDGPKPTCTPPPNRTATVSIPGGTVVK
jgi:hypothetical protein